MAIKIRIKKHERGLWFRHGDFRRILAPGPHRFWSRLWSLKERVEIVDTLKTKFEHTMLDILEAAVRGQPPESRQAYMRANAARYGVDLGNLTR